MTKIIYNSDNKHSIISGLNTCINTLDSINSNLSNTYIPYNFYYKNSLNNVKYEFKKIEDKIKEYKNDLSNVCEKLNKNELELQSKINKIEEIIVEKM